MEKVVVLLRVAEPDDHWCERIRGPVGDELLNLGVEGLAVNVRDDLHAFFGAADDADLHDRMTRMVASTSAFGATDNIDTVPTSRFPVRSPFAT